MLPRGQRAVVRHARLDGVRAAVRGGRQTRRPDQPVIALLGDGAMQLNGLAELITVSHLWQRWRDPRLVVLVLNNRDQNGMGAGRQPSSDPTHRRPDVPYAGWARLLGLHGVRVDRQNWSARPGTRRWPPTVPAYWRRSSTRRCRWRRRSPRSPTCAVCTPRAPRPGRSGSRWRSPRTPTTSFRCPGPGHQ
ncbi:thiamine pyrophosphate-dependent enzyme [Micromonospora sp. M12]